MAEGDHLAVEEAMARLAVVPDHDAGHGPGECVHTLTGPPFSIGAHWYLDAARAAFEQYPPQEAGPTARAFGHGVVIQRDSGPLFFATRENQ